MMTCVVDILLIHLILEGICLTIPAVLMVAITWNVGRRGLWSGASHGIGSRIVILLILSCTVCDWVPIMLFYRGIVKGVPSLLIGHPMLEFGLVVPVVIASIVASRYAKTTKAGKPLTILIRGSYIGTGTALILLLMLVVWFLSNTCGSF